MSQKKVHSHNKSGRPDNIVEKENAIFLECRRIEESLPDFLNDYFIFLRGNNLPASRLEYLREVLAFFTYLTDATNLVKAKNPKEITLEEFSRLTARDVNVYLDYLRNYTVERKDCITVYENGSKTLARKKSSLSVLFRELHREGLMKENISEGFDPIRVPRAGEHEIKALDDDEVMRMLDAVTVGSGLSPHEKTYWEKTKKRDKAILLLFLTYGLRLSELQQLNLSSFNMSRGEFKIYRKRDKEAIMPLNRSCEGAVKDYIENERKSNDDLPEESRDALFLSLQEKRMTGRQIRELVKKYTSIALRTSRKEGYSPHKLRATAATSLIGRGESIYDVAALLDHEQVTTTQLYAKTRRGLKRDLVRGMEWELERREGLPEEEKAEDNTEENADFSALSKDDSSES
ncbi:MAG: tyrosine-type recombinase/integrase [Eubacteriales bacterium]|nr:tyrosine-type recombinase/integrase [Eubacteriales bacterium]